MIDVTRAWKDEEYFNNLSDEQRSALPANPAGVVDLRDEQLDVVVGGIYGNSSGWSYVHVRGGEC